MWSRASIARKSAAMDAAILDRLSWSTAMLLDCPYPSG
jgi:hypothetical protein